MKKNTEIKYQEALEVLEKSKNEYIDKITINLHNCYEILNKIFFTYSYIEELPRNINIKTENFEYNFHNDKIEYGITIKNKSNNIINNVKEWDITFKLDDAIVCVITSFKEWKYSFCKNLTQDIKNIPYELYPTISLFLEIYLDILMEENLEKRECSCGNYSLYSLKEFLEKKEKEYKFNILENSVLNKIQSIDYLTPKGYKIKNIILEGIK